MIRLIEELYSYWNVLWVQIWVELKVSVVGTRLGYLWWILDPLFLMMVYYFVMGIIFQRGDPDYHVFLLCGLVPWQWFTRALILGTTAITRNTHLIKQTNIPLPIYILAPILIQMFFAFFGFAIVVLFVFKISFPLILFLFPLMFLQIIFTFGLSCFLSVANVYFHDTQHFIAYTLRFGMYLSPILYSTSQVLDSEKIPKIGKILYLFNPFVLIIPGYRDILMYGQSFDWRYLFLWIVVSLVLLETGLKLLRTRHGHVPKMI